MSARVFWSVAGFLVAFVGGSLRAAAQGPTDFIFADGFESASAQIQAARDAPDGPVDLPLSGVLVTYVKPAVGSEPAGFFVQGAQPGPALFINVDPLTPTPPAEAGDRVSFDINFMSTIAGLRAATAISGWARQLSGFPLSNLVQDVSSSTDLVTGVAGYESELIRIEGTVVSAFSAAGAGYVQAGLSTDGLFAEPNLRLRLVQAVRDAHDITLGCQVVVHQAPLWRFNAQAQASAWAQGDVSVVSCPSPRVLGAQASSPTGAVDAGTVNFPGDQFTIPGLAVTSATVSGARQVSVTTSAQTPSALYNVSVAATVTDTRGSGVAVSANSASFLGFVP
jgi:hypothetical protein